MNSEQYTTAAFNEALPETYGDFWCFAGRASQYIYLSN